MTRTSNAQIQQASMYIIISSQSVKRGRAVFVRHRNLCHERIKQRRKELLCTGYIHEARESSAGRESEYE